jgi:hypothetical protein
MVWQQRARYEELEICRCHGLSMNKQTNIERVLEKASLIKIAIDMHLRS